MSQLDDILEHSRRREKELTDMAERLLTSDAEIAALRAQLKKYKEALAEATSCLIDFTELRCGFKGDEENVSNLAIRTMRFFRLLDQKGIVYEAKPTDEDKMIEGTWDPNVIESDWPLMTCPDCETTVDWSGIDPEEVQMEMDCPECGVHWEAELIFRVQIQHPDDAQEAR